MDSATNDLTFTVDGVAVTKSMTSYRFQTPAFTFVTPPNNNYLEANEEEPCYSDLIAAQRLHPGRSLGPWTQASA